MLPIKITLEPEKWDEKNGEFIPPKTQTIQLEHSLISISKWESKWCKSFIHTKEMSVEETIDYIKCMTLTQNVRDDVYNCISNDNILQIREYINAPMTATTFSNSKTGKKNREIITSELIYYWMVAFNIPFECQKWHLNRLITLIRVCETKNEPSKKRSKKDVAAEYARLNAARKKAMNTRG